jgi:hypothetical protein
MHFTLLHILILADLYNTLSSHDLAIQVIRKGCRWLQGRARQGYWDGVEDDREWDPDLPGFNRAARVAAAAQMGVHVGVEDDNEGGGSGSGRVLVVAEPIMLVKDVSWSPGGIRWMLMLDIG